MFIYITGSSMFIFIAVTITISENGDVDLFF